MGETGENDDNSKIEKAREEIRKIVGQNKDENLFLFLHGTYLENAISIVKEGLSFPIHPGLVNTALEASSHNTGYGYQISEQGGIVLVKLPRFEDLYHKANAPYIQEGKSLIDYGTLFLHKFKVVKELGGLHYYATLDPRFIAGYYDVDKGTWVDSEKYWENILEAKKGKEGWSEEKYQKERENYLKKIKTKAENNFPLVTKLTNTYPKSGPFGLFERKNNWGREPDNL